MHSRGFCEARQARGPHIALNQQQIHTGHSTDPTDSLGIWVSRGKLTGQGIAYLRLEIPVADASVMTMIQALDNLLEIESGLVLR